MDELNSGKFASSSVTPAPWQPEASAGAPFSPRMPEAPLAPPFAKQSPHSPKPGPRIEADAVQQIERAHEHLHLVRAAAGANEQGLETTRAAEAAAVAAEHFCPSHWPLSRARPAEWRQKDRGWSPQ